jgi:hypothetical protein
MYFMAQAGSPSRTRNELEDLRPGKVVIFHLPTLPVISSSCRRQLAVRSIFKPSMESNMELVPSRRLNAERVAEAGRQAARAADIRNDVDALALRASQLYQLQSKQLSIRRRIWTSASARPRWRPECMPRRSVLQSSSLNGVYCVPNMQS